MTLLLAVLAAAVPSPCPRHFTVRAAARGIRHTFHGDRPLSRAAQRRVARYERCTATNAHGHHYLRWLVAHERALLHLRIADAVVTPYVGPDGRRWAIPWPIVNCESRGENLPPNGDGASGPYQILGSTWTLFGGSGPAAYLASKPEQDAVARRIWTKGGPTQWVCSGLVGGW